MLVEVPVVLVDVLVEVVLVEVEVEVVVVPSHSSLELPHGKHSQFGPIGANPLPQQQQLDPQLVPVSSGQQH